MDKTDYNLEERTAQFGKNIISLCKGVKKDDAIARPIISQLVRSGTSVGANYMEANAASSKKDFRNKIHIAKKETEETKHWLRMISECTPTTKKEAQKLWKEAQELTFIFGKILSSMRKNNS